MAWNERGGGYGGARALSSGREGVNALIKCGFQGGQGLQHSPQEGMIELPAQAARDAAVCAHNSIAPPNPSGSHAPEVEAWPYTAQGHQRDLRTREHPQVRIKISTGVFRLVAAHLLPTRLPPQNKVGPVRPRCKGCPISGDAGRAEQDRRMRVAELERDVGKMSWWRSVDDATTRGCSAAG